jgi:hypothetical protein
VIPFFPQGVYGARETSQGSALRSMNAPKPRALDSPPSPLLCCVPLGKNVIENGSRKTANQARARKKRAHFLGGDARAS